MPFRRNAKRKTGYRRKRAYSKKPGKVSKPLRTYISRAIRRNEETKFTSNSYTLTNFNSSITSSSDLVTLLPGVIQGTGQNNRIGNRIRPVRMEITGYVVYQCFANTNQDARMLGGRLFVVQDKTSRAQSNNIYNYNLLDLGGSSTNFSGTAMNWVTPHNNDQFTFFADRKMKFLKPFGYTNNQTPTTSNAITGMDSSLFHPFKIVLTQKKLPSVLIYDQTDDTNYPTNFNPVIALGYCDLLNAGADTTTTQLAMQFNCTLYYKDA